MNSKPDVAKIIAAIKKTKGDRKYCYNLPEHMSDYTGSIVEWLKATSPVKIDALVEHIEELKRKVEALAVECAELKKFCKNASFDADYEAELSMERGGFTDALNDIETPATDAAIAEIEARGMANFVPSDEFLTELIRASNRGDTPEQWRSSMRDVFAKQLRKESGQ